ncbi:hypothetical protein [Kitasatospora cinereorecta]|uniref:Uncharacterized protein n=1 Tax=Kitasatospora cinereorecta TaxID=285560 RepID=A0ABW0VCI3_9ACTN
MKSTATLTEAQMPSRPHEPVLSASTSRRSGPDRPVDRSWQAAPRVRHTITTGALAVYTVVATLVGLGVAAVAARLGTGDATGQAAGVVFFSVLGVFSVAAVAVSDVVLQRMTKPQQR